MGWMQPMRRRDRPRRRPDKWLDCCQGKVRYRDRTQAKAAAACIRQAGAELRPYHCFNCHGWHLTSQEPKS